MLRAKVNVELNCRESLHSRVYFKGCQFGLHHLGDDLLEGRFRLPMEQAPGFGSIAHQMVHFGGAVKLGINLHVLFPIQLDAIKGEFEEFLSEQGFFLKLILHENAGVGTAIFSRRLT